jgi:pectate lyase
VNEQSLENVKSGMSGGSCDMNGDWRCATRTSRVGGGRGWLAAATAFVIALGCSQSDVSAAAAATAPPADNTPLAFPGAVGWAAHTPGGRGGKIIKVTTLAPTGPGSFIEAVETPGPRIIVFEVGGVIDLNRQTVRIKEPYLTIAGQTAPSPGITLIRGGIDIYGHDVIVRHIRVRVGTTGAPHFGNVDFDAISTIAAHDVIVDHCSLTWATDENLSASGPRFTGKTPDEWREGTSHRVTFSNNIIAEGLAHASHIKGEHSKGSLIHDNVSDILIVGNLYSHNKERNPLFKGGVRGAVVNNLIYDPGDKATHYNLIAEEWGDHEKQVGHMTLIGNVYRAGISTRPELPLFMIGGSGDMELYAADNIMVDWIGRKVAEQGSYTNAPVGTLKAKKPMLPAGFKALSARETQDSVIRNAGARPWDRQLDGNDWRIVADAIESRGYVIDSEADVGGYPVQIPTFAPFDASQWDLDTMTRKSGG